MLLEMRGCNGCCHANQGMKSTRLTNLLEYQLFHLEAPSKAHTQLVEVQLLSALQRQVNFLQKSPSLRASKLLLVELKVVTFVQRSWTVNSSIIHADYCSNLP
jgi:hypothetical protein